MQTKHNLYLRSLLKEIGLLQDAAAIVLYEDNQGSLLMTNAQHATKRTRHIDLKYFVLQEVQHHLMILHRINTGHNCYADAMPKALATRTLFYRHMNFVMGRIVPAYACTHNESCCP